MGDQIEADDIVQITDTRHHWFPTLIVVDEIKSFGVQGFTFMPNNKRDEKTACAYIRLVHGQYEKVGTVLIRPEFDPNGTKPMNSPHMEPLGNDGDKP